MLTEKKIRNIENATTTPMVWMVAATNLWFAALNLFIGYIVAGKVSGAMPGIDFEMSVAAQLTAAIFMISIPYFKYIDNNPATSKQEAWIILMLGIGAVGIHLTSLSFIWTSEVKSFTIVVKGFITFLIVIGILLDYINGMVIAQRVNKAFNLSKKVIKVEGEEKKNKEKEEVTIDKATATATTKEKIKEKIAPATKK